MLLFRLITFLCLFCLITGNAFAQACVGGHVTSANQTTPAGLSKFMILSAEETFNDPAFSSDNSTSNPAIAGDRFDIDIMARTPSAQVIQRGLAVDYFKNQFDVDFNIATLADPNHDLEAWLSNDNNWVLLHYTVEPRYNQRIVYAGGETVDSSGWLVHQGFYRMMSLSSSAPIAGAWSGAEPRIVQQFTFADFGEMRIKIPCVTSGFDDLDLNYESIRPYYPDVLAIIGGSTKGYFGSRANIDYNISQESSVLTGTARGRVELKSLPANDYTAQVRIILKLS